MKFIKLSVFTLFCGILAAYMLHGLPARANQTGALASLTGAPGEQNCTECHTGAAVNSGSGTLAINGLPANYTPNQEITVTVSLGQSGRTRFGFELTAIDSQGRKAGDIVVTDTNRTFTRTGVVQNNLRQYITHTFNGTAANGTNQSTWSFTWRAPAQSVGNVTFYVAGNATNSSNSEFGDLIYTKNATIQPAAVLANFASVSAASFSSTAPLAADAIAAGFGTGLSQNVVVASVVPLPTQLDGTEVEVKDITGTGRNAGLFFVSPGQINYLIPQDTVNGVATVTVKRSGTAVAQGTITVDSAAPALFSANANGQGVAAAVVLRRRNGVDTFEPVSQVVGGQAQAIPIDLGPETDVVVLLAFGSGFRNASQSTLSATIGGTASTFVATAPVAGFAGLDQANILIPRSLIGRGLVDVVFNAGGKTANTVQINVK